MGDAQRPTTAVIAKTVRDPLWWFKARADLSGANLSASDLSGSNFARATLRGTKLTRAILRGAYFGPERIPDAPDQLEADLTDADLTNADLTGADLSHANLTGAGLDHASLTNVFDDRETTWPQGFDPPPSRPPAMTGQPVGRGR